MSVVHSNKKTVVAKDFSSTSVYNFTAVSFLCIKCMCKQIIWILLKKIELLLLVIQLLLKIFFV